MKSKEEIKEIAISTLLKEANAIRQLEFSINDDFIGAVETILHCKGRVIVTGIGKSGNIATKIVSTFNSTGTRAIFMHAADAIHGDLGMITPDDVIICLSKSGNTPEIKVLLPLLKSMGSRLIAIVGNGDSFLARMADFVLDVSVDKEACPNNLAPTSSTTAQLAMGDALAVSLLECKGFTSSDFARYHPGGALGKRLYLRVTDLYTANEKPLVDADADIKETIMEITSKRLGATAVMENDRLCGIITDGDLRRMLQNEDKYDQLSARDIMTPLPKTINEHILVADALDIMRENNITQLLVLDNNDTYVGIIHLHDILKEGVI